MLASDSEEQEETLGSPQQDEYVDLEMYNNKYYTHDSGSNGKGLFALTDFDEIKGWNSDPCHHVCMCKVKVLADKSTMEQPKYAVAAKECLVT